MVGVPMNSAERAYHIPCSTLAQVCIRPRSRETALRSGPRHCGQSAAGLLQAAAAMGKAMGDIAAASDPGGERKLADLARKSDSPNQHALLYLAGLLALSVIMTWLFNVSRGRSGPITLEADHNDPRDYSDEQGVNRLEAFVEMMEARA